MRGAKIWWHGKFGLASVAKMGQCLGGGLLSLSLSRCSHFLARLWAKFKGLFYSFCRSFFSSYRKFFLFHRSFLSSFCLQKAFFRALCFFEIFKLFIFGLLRPFCHFEPLQKGDPTGCKAQAAAKKSKEFKIRFVYGYFANAQYDSRRVIASRLPKNGGFCHFERSEKSKEFKIRFVYGYFANAQYDKKSVWYDKFGLLSKNDGYFHSNFRDKIYKFYSFFWIATLALLARNDGKAKIQIFYSKFNSFHKFNSNFKPYTRLFHIFTPSFCSVQTDKKFFTRRTLCLNRNF